MTTPPPPVDPDETDDSVHHIDDDDAWGDDTGEVPTPLPAPGAHEWLGIPVLLTWGATGLIAMVWMASDRAYEHNTARYGVYSLITGIAAVVQTLAATLKLPVLLRACSLTWSTATAVVAVSATRYIYADMTDWSDTIALDLVVLSIVSLVGILATSASAWMHWRAAQHFAALQRGEFLAEAYMDEFDEEP